MSLKIVFKPIKSIRLSETVENSIRDMILLKKLVPGERLPTEKEIGMQLSVSPVTVREALRGLEAIGMIKKKKGHRGGIFVSEVDIDLLKVPLYSYLNSKKVNYEHIFETRKIIETAIIRMTVPQITDDEIQPLAANVKACENILRNAKKGLSESKIDELKQKNIEFHKLLAARTRNPILIFTLEYIIDFIYAFRKADLVFDVEFLMRSTKEHREIVKYVKERDIERSEKRLVSHLETVIKYHRIKYR